MVESFDEIEVLAADSGVYIDDCKARIFDHLCQDWHKQGMEPDPERVSREVDHALEHPDQHLIAHSPQTGSLYWFQLCPVRFSQESCIRDVLLLGDLSVAERVARVAVRLFKDHQPKAITLSALGVGRLPAYSRKYAQLGFQPWGVVNSRRITWD